MSWFLFVEVRRQVWFYARKGDESSKAGRVLWRLTQLWESPWAINAFSFLSVQVFLSVFPSVAL